MIAMTPELISTAVLAALTIAEKAGVTELTKKAVTDAYDSLKSILHTKLGRDSEPAQALAKLEANPASAGRKTTLTEELATIDLTDPTIIAAAQSLLTAIHALPPGGINIQSIHGNDNVQASGGSTIHITHSVPVRHD